MVPPTAIDSTLVRRLNSGLQRLAELVLAILLVLKVSSSDLDKRRATQRHHSGEEFHSEKWLELYGKNGVPVPLLYTPMQS